jgi:hypothetical protein
MNLSANDRIIGHTKTTIPAQFELKDGSSVEDFEAWVKDKVRPSKRRRETWRRLRH